MVDQPIDDACRRLPSKQRWQNLVTEYDKCDAFPSHYHHRPVPSPKSQPPPLAVKNSTGAKTAISTVDEYRIAYHVLQMNDLLDVSVMNFNNMNNMDSARNSLGKARAVFTIPSTFATDLIRYPVLCRGAYFTLQLDTSILSPPTRTYGVPVSSNLDNNVCHNDVAFLTTEYYSPTPKITAAEIALRLSNRLQTLQTERSEQPQTASVEKTIHATSPYQYGEGGAGCSPHSSTTTSSYSVISNSSPVDIAAILDWRR
jgi:hypothetical protein